MCPGRRAPVRRNDSASAGRGCRLLSARAATELGGQQLAMDGLNDDFPSSYRREDELMASASCAVGLAFHPTDRHSQAACHLMKCLVRQVGKHC
ncbi:hypothetical protein PVAP13_4KG048465 [Panicum virgatum]|uniref:Uncharacterized protein n=1 Tax=Panicum virgatum TaxID=38727 RepID=A0A8T0TK85_PANVG|nr:hypothetical protein PVAP13_4KG048465 [Panicum virgatum]